MENTAVSVRRADRKSYQIWNQAVAAVRDACADMPNHLPLTPGDHRLLAVVLNLCGQLTYDEELSRWRSNAELARKYGCSPRTICNWRAAGAPLGSQWKMLDWLAHRHCIPQGTARKFKVQLDTRKGWSDDPMERSASRVKALRELVGQLES